MLRKTYVQNIATKAYSYRTSSFCFVYSFCIRELEWQLTIIFCEQWRVVHIYFKVDEWYMIWSQKIWTLGWVLCGLLINDNGCLQVFSSFFWNHTCIMYLQFTLSEPQIWLILSNPPFVISINIYYIFLDSENV